MDFLLGIPWDLQSMQMQTLIPMTQHLESQSTTGMINAHTEMRRYVVDRWSQQGDSSHEGICKQELTAQKVAVAKNHVILLLLLPLLSLSFSL